jgi:putative nucleotidyltransferase with HDIG domain
MDKVDFGGFPRINHLKLAGFLHDIGKYSTWTIEEDTGRHRFIKHDDVGSKMCVKYLKDLKFSKKQVEYISTMIKTHIYPSNVIAAPDLSEKVMMRYLRKMEDNVIDNIILAKADRLSARGEDITDDMIKSNLDGLDKLLNFYLKNRDSMQPLPKLLDGNEIMEMLNIKPSPKLGKILDALHEAQLSGNVNTKDDAEVFVKAYKL